MINFDIFEVDIGSEFKRIDLTYCGFDLFVELMGPNALQNAIVLVGQNDVTLGIELKDEMICEGFGSEGNDDDSFDPDLFDGFNSFGAKVFSKAHGES